MTLAAEVGAVPGAEAAAGNLGETAAEDGSPADAAWPGAGVRLDSLVP
jgi:hypothetical protein